MRILLSLGLFAALLSGMTLLGFAQTAAPPPPPAVAVGQPAPDFALPYLAPAKEGDRPERKEVRLSELKGRKNVVLAFFPAAFSPG